MSSAQAPTSRILARTRELANSNSRRHRLDRTIVGEAVYSSAKDTTFTIVELSAKKELAVQEYLRKSERIVEVTFPDASRRRKIDTDKWEVTLLQQNFFGVEFCPCAELKVWNKEGVLRIQVSDLDLSDLPPEIQVPAKILVEGSMSPHKKSASSKIVNLKGQVKISLDVDVPEPYSSFPLVKDTIETILTGVITRLEESLRSRLPGDYTRWTRETTIDVKNVMNVSAES